MLTAGVIVVIISMACYGAYVVSHPAIMWLNTVDLHVYVRGGRAVLTRTPLYNWPNTTNQCTYPPFAALLFVVAVVAAAHAADHDAPSACGRGRGRPGQQRCVGGQPLAVGCALGTGSTG